MCFRLEAMAKKTRPIHTCSECGYVSPKWLGRCPDCGAWGTLEEKAPVVAVPGAPASKGVAPSSPAQPITKIGAQATKTVRTGIGGSVALADPAADWPVFLSTFGATLRIVGRNGVRVQSIDDFIQGPYETTLSTGDIIMGFDIPAPPASFRWGFSKVARKSGAFAQSLAVVVAAGKGGPVKAVLGAAGPKPRALVATAAQLEIPDSSEQDIRVAIRADLNAYFGELDDYQKRMHTANVLHAARNMRAQ